MQNSPVVIEESVRDLPVGISAFSIIRNRNLLYADKTDLIYTMVKKFSRIFISRPSRFGKSLLLSTLEALFSGQIELFKNLKIEKLWTDTNKYRIVRLDFSEVKDKNTHDEMQIKFNKILNTGFGNAGFVYKENGISLISQLSSWLNRQNGDIVLLIDEYDAPLNANLHHEELFNFAKQMTAEFFTTVKARDKAFRLVFMTGIAKFDRAGVFSGMNHLRDISLMPEFGTLLGITEAELRQYFGWYLEQSAKVRHETVQELLDNMREMYDGFCFDNRAETHVFAPWSVLNFLSDSNGNLDNYWFDSAGNPSVIRNLMRAGLFIKPEQSQREFTVSLMELQGSQSIEEFNAVVLMFQAGYLSIKDVDGNGVMATLAYPNKEVVCSMELLRTQELTSSDRLDFIGLNKISSYLQEQNKDGVIDCLNHFFASIVYDRYPVKDESTCRGMLYSLFTGLRFTALAERHNCKGSSDLEILTGAPHKKGTIHWVFELKYSKDGNGTDSLLEEAVAQIKSRKYGTPPLAGAVVKVAMVFDGARRQFVKWKWVE